MITRKQNKKEIKEDAFVAFIIQAREYIKTHQNYFFVAIISVIVIVSGVIWYSNNMNSSRINQKNMFSEGLSFYRTGDIISAEDIFTNLKNDYSNSREGIYSKYFLGKCLMASGRNTEAISAFRDYIKDENKYPLYRDAARIGMAAAFENERDFISSAEIYADLASATESEEAKGKYFENAAESYKLAGKRNKAIEMLEKALELLEGPAKNEVELKISILKS